MEKKSFNSSKSLADQLTKHFDRDWSTQRSELRKVTTNRLNYSPVHSWDALSDKPEKFSRLQANNIPTQRCHPCTLSGSRVIELENPSGLSVLNIYDVKQTKSHIPINVIQKDVGLVEQDLSGQIPMVTQAQQEGKTLLLEKSYHFKNYKIQPPEFQAIEKPSYYIQAGSQADQKLLNPAQRRGIMEYETKVSKADKIINEAKFFRSKVKANLTKPTHNRGVAMYDTNENINSEVYGETAKQLAIEREKHLNHVENRRQHLIDCGSHLTTQFGTLIKEDAPQESMYQKKGYAPGYLSFNDTNSRLFQREPLPVPREDRTQHLRDRDLAGKQYDFITNTKIEYWPSKIEQKSNRQMDHPSQTSLQSTRNMQGSLRLY